MRIVIALFAIAVTLMAQGPGSPVNQTQGPAPQAFERLFYYNAGGLVEYVCWSPSDQLAETTIAISAASNASPVSFTYTGGFEYQSILTVKPIVKITGGTGAWAAVNGVWTITPTSTTTFTIAVDSTAFGALAGVSQLTTRSPIVSASRWAINRNFYNASSLLIGSAWAGNPAGVSSTQLTAGGVGFSYACSSRTTFAYQ